MKLLGFTEEITQCDLCGKIELKGTYAIELESGETVYYGTTCGAKALQTTTNEFKAENKKVETIKNFDLAMIEAKSDFKKVDVYKKAIKKGYNKDDFFKKHGELIDSSPWENFYQIAHIVYQIAK